MLERLRLELKSPRFSAIIPLIILGGVIPLLAFSHHQSLPEDLGNPRLFVMFLTQQFVSLFSIWWPTSVLKEYLNSPGSELLFVYRFGWDALLSRMLVLWLWYTLHWTLLRAALSLWLGEMGLLSLLILSQCFS